MGDRMIEAMLANVATVERSETVETEASSAGTTGVTAEATTTFVAATDFLMTDRQRLVRLANNRQATERERLAARLYLLRRAYREAKAAGKPLGQIVANGKQARRRLEALNAAENAALALAS